MNPGGPLRRTWRRQAKADAGTRRRGDAGKTLGASPRQRQPRSSRRSQQPARVLLLLALAGLAGCLSLQVPAPEIHDYRLDYAPPSIQGTALPVVLRVAPFRAAVVYARESIVYRENPYSTGTYFYHRWMANPASMVADLVARDLSSSGLYRAVQQGPSLVPFDYELTADVDEVEERISEGTCTAHLSMRALLSRARFAQGNPVVLRTQYAADEPCACNDPPDLAAAMSRALQQISTQLQQDVHAAVAADPVRKPG